MMRVGSPEADDGGSRRAAFFDSEGRVVLLPPRSLLLSGESSGPSLQEIVLPFGIEGVSVGPDEDVVGPALSYLLRSQWVSSLSHLQKPRMCPVRQVEACPLFAQPSCFAGHTITS
jgi:hypothetical protein